MKNEVGKLEAHEIKQMHEAGMSKKDIAYATQRSRPTIDRVLSGVSREVDERVDMHDRFLGPLTSGCYVGDEEIVEFSDPTCDNAELEELIENNPNLNLLIPKGK
jgi:hypothetical protein